MKVFRKHGLWVLAGAGFLLLGVPKKAWAGIPELKRIPELKQWVSTLKKAPPARTEQEQRRNKEKTKSVLILPIFTRGQP